jgi:hypothetical protein
MTPHQKVFTKRVAVNVGRAPVMPQRKFGISPTNTQKAPVGTIHIKNPNARQPH